MASNRRSLPTSPYWHAARDDHASQNVSPLLPSAPSYISPLQGVADSRQQPLQSPPTRPSLLRLTLSAILHYVLLILPIIAAILVAHYEVIHIRLDSSIPTGLITGIMTLCIALGMWLMKRWTETLFGPSFAAILRYSLPASSLTFPVGAGLGSLMLSTRKVKLPFWLRLHLIVNGWMLSMLGGIGGSLTLAQLTWVPYLDRAPATGQSVIDFARDMVEQMVKDQKDYGLQGVSDVIRYNLRVAFDRQNITSPPPVILAQQGFGGELAAATVPLVHAVEYNIACREDNAYVIRTHNDLQNRQALYGALPTRSRRLGMQLVEMEGVVKPNRTGWGWPEPPTSKPATGVVIFYGHVSDYIRNPETFPPNSTMVLRPDGDLWYDDTTSGGPDIYQFHLWASVCDITFLNTEGSLSTDRGVPTYTSLRPIDSTTGRMALLGTAVASDTSALINSNIPADEYNSTSARAELAKLNIVGVASSMAEAYTVMHNRPQPLALASVVGKDALLLSLRTTYLWTLLIFPVMLFIGVPAVVMALGVQSETGLRFKTWLSWLVVGVGSGVGELVGEEEDDEGVVRLVGRDTVIGFRKGVRVGEEVGSGSAEEGVKGGRVVDVIV
ncbi:hypothetical protein HK097_005972 [Rhizophlyctis rosea]|uniref:Uncharacterized protein n=1 Tax=Rhizophlyctis rosea TaxID=64517 RepID=A0AAD5SQX8_9FUNG|nr:hypothetical protein HK097_005972 [Rhizophlyctis rosea]